MEASFSPIVKKIAGEVVGKRKRKFRAPTDVCLEDWWLSKPDGRKGIAVGGRPVEMRRCDNARKEFHSAPAKKRYASREFHSAQVMKRHSCTTVETSDGLFVYLCGFINRSRTQQNGFSSEVCRDFLYGFPLNWEDHGAKCVEEEPSGRNLEFFAESFLSVALDAYNGAQLHDMVLSLTDAEREILNKKMYDNIMGMVNPERVDDATLQPSKPSPSTPVVDNILTPDSSTVKVKNKQQRNTSLQKHNEQEFADASVSSCTATENKQNTSEMSKAVDAPTYRKSDRWSGKKLENHKTNENATISLNVSAKQKPMEKPARKIKTSKKGARSCAVKLSDATIQKNVNVSPKAFVKEAAVDKGTGVARTSRDRPCKSMSNLKNSRDKENVIASPKASEEPRVLRSAKRNVQMANSTEEEEKFNVEGRNTHEQSEVRQLLENLTSAGKKQKGKSRTMRELKQLLY